MKQCTLYLLILFCWACTPKPVDDVQVFNVDPYHLSDKSFDDFYRLKEVIPLKTTDRSAITEILKVVSVKDRLFISTYSGNNIYCFRRDGEFIHKLERQGKGPGEYLIIKDFVVNQDSSQLIVYDLLGKLIYYDLDGGFLREEKRDSYMSNLEYLPNGNWLINHAMWPTSTINDTAYILRIANSDGDYLTGTFVLPKLISPAPTMPSSLYKDNDRFYVAPITENTIYKYDYQKNTFNPSCIFMLKGHPIPSSLEQKDNQQPFFYKYYVFSCEYVGDKTVMVNAYYLAEMRLLTLIGDKKSGQTHVFPEVFEDKENELTLNRYIQHTGFDGNLVVFARPMQLLERKFKNVNSVGSQLTTKLTEEDNPVLLVYEEK